MSELKHTPGPWRVQKDGDLPYIEAHQGKNWNNPIICHLYEDVTPNDSVTIGAWLKPFDNADNNARLIAAAPELLTATKECADALADIINAAGNGQPYSADELVELFANIRCRADEAVAKATGERI